MTTTTSLELEIDAVERDDGTAYEVSYERPYQPSLVVVTAVATVDGRDPIDLRPLHDVIDTDALDRLLEGAWRRSSSLQVAFSFEGFAVEFRAPGRVRLEPLA